MRQGGGGGDGDGGSVVVDGGDGGVVRGRQKMKIKVSLCVMLLSSISSCQSSSRWVNNITRTSRITSEHN